MATATAVQAAPVDVAGLLASRVIRVKLTIKSWGATVKDKAAAKETAVRAGADEEMFLATKRLIAPAALERINKAARAARGLYLERTLPWGEPGEARAIEASAVIDLFRAMHEHETEWTDAFDEFRANWAQHYNDAQYRLGSAFNADEYPRDVASRFAFSLETMPLDQVDDFRINASNAVIEMLRQDAEARIARNYDGAIADIRTRVEDAVSRVVAALSGFDPTKTGKDRGTFRDTLVSNVQDLADLLRTPGFNLTGTLPLDALADRLDAQLCSVSADTLRESDADRTQVAQSAEQILADMDQYFA